MKNKLRLYIFAALTLACGIGVGIKFFIWALDEIEKRSSASNIVTCFFASFAFFALGCVGFMLFTFGRGAFLKIESGRLLARWGMNRELDIPLSAVEDVAVMGKTVHIFEAKRVHSISAPAKKEDMLTLIACQKKPWEINESAERAAYEKAKKAHAVSMTAVCVLLAVIVLNILLCSQLTEGKAPSELTPAEDGVWLAFFFASVLAVIAAFFAADKAGKLTLERERRMRRIGSYVGYLRRYEGIDTANAQRVVLFDSYRIRVTVKYIYGGYVYDMELIDPVSGTWVMGISEEFGSLEEANGAVDCKLGDVPVDEDRIFD